jgi:hypothetical protein
VSEKEVRPLYFMLGIEVKPELPKAFPGGALARPRSEQIQVSTARKMAVVRSQSKHPQGLPPGKAAVITANGLRYSDRGDYVPEAEPTKPKRAPKPRAKYDPQLVNKVRELRDRCLEEFNRTPLLGCGKYEVARQMTSTKDEAAQSKPIALLPEPVAA